MPLGLRKGMAALAAQLPPPEVLRIDTLVLPVVPRFRIPLRQQILYLFKFLFGNNGLVLLDLCQYFRQKSRKIMLLF